MRNATMRAARGTGMPRPALALAALLGAAGLALAGCTPEAPEPMPAPTATPSDSASPAPEPTVSATSEPGEKVSGTRYTSIDAFKKDVAAATGVDCGVFEQVDEIPAASASGWCSGDIWGLSLYESAAERNSVLEEAKSGAGGRPFLVGPNWILAGNEMFTEIEFGLVQEQLDGLYWMPKDPIPAE
ncbi:hypothetical protein [Homoserinibacter sp. YIM 151385]|uniref:hypothetical protein n=1 Tax=Homoserinibacter sp. YIM 151385 TaxID=2985506 RepID=UPI0022F0D585|nr:hypothetical protein [Homoserinibacter sp. YIM 151385]WBU37856.1 hypothetical protein OF852_13200 [Homoserinibacter sp. YIM 151385]